MNSLKTTGVGILILVGAIVTAAIALFDGDPATGINAEEIMAALVGAGFMVARDNDVSSEDAKVKR